MINHQHIVILDYLLFCFYYISATTNIVLILDYLIRSGILMSVKDDMEDGEISDNSTEDGPLFQYNPLQRPVAPKPGAFSSKTPVDDDEYDSDTASPDIDNDSGSDSDSELNKPKAKQSRSGLWARRDALVVEDGGGETFKQMAQVFQAQRDAKGLNKQKKKNNVWGSFIQEESLNAEMSGSLGVGKSLKDLHSDRGAETYDFTQIAKERREEERRRKQEEKQKRDTQLDDDMDSYWNKKNDINEIDEGRDSPKDDAMDDTTLKDDEGDRRGTKRSVRDRLGDKKVKMDRYKNEVLPPPGKPRQIPDIAEDSLVEGSDDDFGKEIAERLQEEKVDMIIDLVTILGRRVVWDFFKKTQKTESEGGMMINNGARRRTAGGVFCHLLRSSEGEMAEKAKEYFRESQKNEQKRRILHAKSKKKKKFEDEMEDFLKRKREIEIEKSKENEENMEDDSVKSETNEEEELKPLPNILSMIASSLNPNNAQKETAKPAVDRVSSFKEPDAPPNSVERVDRNLIDYEDDDFLTSNNDTEDIEIF